MYAAIMTVDVPSDALEQARVNIQKNAAGMRNAPGFQHAEWIYEQASGRMTVVVVFDNESQANDAWERMGPTVTKDIEANGARIVSRSGGEVIHHV